MIRLVESPPPTPAFPICPETLRVMPRKPAPEVPVAALFLPRLVRGIHEIQSGRRVGRCHPVFRLFGTIKALEWGARAMLEMCEFVHAPKRPRGKE